MTIREVREHLAAALAPLGVSVHAYPPNALRAPAVVMLPGDPYREAYSLASVAVRLDVQIIVSDTDAGAAGRLDDLIDGAITLLIGAGASGIQPTSGAPQVTDGFLTTRIPTMTIWQET